MLEDNGGWHRNSREEGRGQRPANLVMRSLEDTATQVIELRGLISVPDACDRLHDYACYGCGIRP